MDLDQDQLLNRARQCLQLEREAIEKTEAALGQEFLDAIAAIRDTVVAGHKLIFTGVGKNVPICQKLMGTFNSTGVPTTYLDPNQALHGDLGLCSEGDLAFLFSNSGETEDLIRVLPFLKRLGLKTLAVTANKDSTLVRNADLAVYYAYGREACPLNLAPTASTTAALALGDTLAMVYLEIRGFTREDFARFHPAGTLGRSLLLRIHEIMRSRDRFAAAPANITVQDALLAITKARCGSIALTDPESGSLVGVFSDGDFRRAALQDPESILRQPVKDYMTPHPKTIAADALAVEALKVFEKYAIDDLIVVDDANRPIGIVDGQDMPKLRVL